MKYKIRKTGEAVDVISYSSFIERTEFDYVSFIDSKGVEHISEQYNLYWDFEPLGNDVVSINGIDWEQRRYEIAKDMLAACQASNSPQALKMAIEFASKWAVETADALIEELKKGGQDEKIDESQR